MTCKILRSHKFYVERFLKVNQKLNIFIFILYILYRYCVRMHACVTYIILILYNIKKEKRKKKKDTFI